MNKHYVLNINPQASNEWDRCVLRNPITGERPALKEAIAQAVQDRPGSYLIKVSLNVEILEKTIPHNPPTTIKPIQTTSAKLLTIPN